MTLLSAPATEVALWVALVPLALALGYAMVLYTMSRYEPGETSLGMLPPVRSRAKWAVVLLPCGTEAPRLAETMRGLLALDQPRMRILVLDDGSLDTTADVVRAVQDPRVHLVPRSADQAVQGQSRGQALNALLSYLRSADVVDVADEADVVIGVLSPGERYEPDTWGAVLPAFDDPGVGVVEIGARVEGRRLLAGVHDLEEVLRAEVFQRGRQHLGGRGQGCGGQFVRLSALSSLGAAPWSQRLAPELDLGVRLVVAGWKSEFTAASAVHRSGPTGVGGWLGQRTRRVHAQMQCLSLLPAVMTAGGRVTRVQLVRRLSGPVLLLVGSLVGLAVALWAGALGIGLALQTATPAWWWALPYLVALIPALLLAGSYREVAGPADSVAARWRTVGVMHLYPGYLALVGLAGWWALMRVVTRHDGEPRRSPRVAHRPRHRKSRRAAWARLVAPACLVGTGALAAIVLGAGGAPLS